MVIRHLKSDLPMVFASFAVIQLSQGRGSWQMFHTVPFRTRTTAYVGCSAGAFHIISTVRPPAIAATRMVA